MHATTMLYGLASTSLHINEHTSQRARECQDGRQPQCDLFVSGEARRKMFDHIEERWLGIQGSAKGGQDGVPGSLSTDRQSHQLIEPKGPFCGCNQTSNDCINQQKPHKSIDQILSRHQKIILRCYGSVLS